MENVKRILKELQLEDLFQKFKDECVDDEILTSLSADEIAKLIPTIGKQAKFRKLIENLKYEETAISPTEVQNKRDAHACGTVSAWTSDWNDMKPMDKHNPVDVPVQIKQEVIDYSVPCVDMVEPKNEDSGDDPKDATWHPPKWKDMTPVYECPATSKPSKRMKTDVINSKSSIDLDVIEILSRDLNGKAVKKYFFENGILSEETRRLLVDLIVDELLKQSEKLSNRDLAATSRKIQETFPSENPEIYFCPPTPITKIARGKLVDRYRNRRRIFKRYGIFDTTIARKDSGEGSKDGCSDSTMFLPYSGDMCKEPTFRNLLQDFKSKDTNVSTSESQSEVVGPHCASSPSDWDTTPTPNPSVNLPDKHKNSTVINTGSYIQLNLPEVLSRDLNGKVIKKYYYENGTLNEETRRLLVELVIDELLKQSEKLSNRDLSITSMKIQEVFGPENPEIYFCPPSSLTKISRGKLVDRYRNRRRIFKRYGLFESDVPKKSAGEGSTDESVQKETPPSWSGNEFGKQANFRSLLDDLKCEDTEISIAKHHNETNESSNRSVGGWTPTQWDGIRATQHDSLTNTPSQFRRETVINTVSCIDLDLADILSRDLNGRVVKKYYCENGTLNEETRRLLVELIIDELLRQSEKLSNRDLAATSTKIQEIFPNEKPEIYFCPPSSITKIARGKLVDKYRNRRRIFRRYGMFETERVKNQGGEGSHVIHIQPYEDDPSFKWLKYNTEPWSQVTECWRATQQLRLQELMSQNFQSVGEYMNKWPILRQPLGHSLIDIDFESLYPGKENALLNSWSQLSKALHTHLKANLLSSNPLKQHLVMDFEQQSEDSKALFLLLALPFVCKPSAIRKVKGSVTKAWKPSVLESQEGMLLHIENPGQLLEVLERKRKKMDEFNLTIQPLTIAVGPANSLKDFFVFVDGTFYKAGSLIKAVDITFKSFFSLRTSYPFEAYQLWYFLQVVAFDIQTKWDKHSPNVMSLLSSLKL